MRSIIVAIGAIVISVAAKSAPVSPTPLSTEETRKAAYQYGICVVQRRASGASKAVLSNVDTETLNVRYRALFDVCRIDGTIVFPGDFYVYTLADALVALELTALPVPDLSQVPPLPGRSTPTFAKLKRKYGYDAALQATRDADVYGALNAYGECVVRKSPANAKALLMAKPESAEELSRFEALSPALSACAPAEQKVELTKFLVRGTIALNYYRLAQAARHVAIH
jgi:hypothetical protein